MTSIKQIEANQKNALKSTGPKTEDGKAAVRPNALKHGMLSRQTLLPDEDGAALTELAESLRADLQPVGALEDTLVDLITARLWRLRRLGHVEAAIFDWQLYAIRVKRSFMEDRASDRASELDMDDDDWVSRDDEKHREDLLRDKAARDAAARDLQEKSDTIGLAFIRDASHTNAFSKLSRYETGLVRELFQFLHELQRRQASRTGQPTLPPVAVDVNVSRASEDPV